MLKIIFSYPTELPNEVDMVNEVLATEIDYFHIRKPEFDTLAMQNYIESIHSEHYHKLVVHSHYECVKRYELAGIHLNKKGLNSIRTEEESDKCYIEPLLLKNRQIEVFGDRPGIVSASAHSFDEILSFPFAVDYVTLSPIYDSITKPGYKSEYTDIQKLKLFLAGCPTKVIALGGVKEENEAALKEIGFAGFAILGQYWHNKKQNNISQN